MLDKVNRIFALLAKQEALKYALLGMVFGVTFIYLADQKSHFDIIKKAGYLGLFFIVIYPCLRSFFYEKYELGSKKLRMTSKGMIIRDEYFYTKINSNLPKSKKVCGYTYVLFRVFQIVTLSFFISALLSKFFIEGVM